MSHVVLLTGASGFLGSSLARRFQDCGNEVALLLRPGSSLRRLEPRRFRQARCATPHEIRAFVADVAPDVVVHTACLYGREGETLRDLLEANVALGVTLLDALLALPERSAPRLFLNTGSSLPPELGAYALSKHQLVQWGRQQAAQHPRRLHFVNVALEHMFGPGDSSTKFTTRVLRACQRHEPELALTAGEQRRDFIFIDDVVAAYETLLRQSPALPNPAEVPVGSGEAPTVREFVETVHELCASRTRLAFGAVPYREGELMYSRADVTRLRELGWQPRWPLRAALRETIEHDPVHP